MNTSEKLDRLLPALLAVQKEVSTVKKTADNPYFKSKYVDLASVVEAVYPVLHENGVLVVQGFDDTNVDGGKVIVVTRLFHAESGQFIESRFKLDSKPDPQGNGSAGSYGRRYSLMAILGLVGEDDDAEGAMKPFRGPQKQATDPTAGNPKTQERIEKKAILAEIRGIRETVNWPPEKAVEIMGIGDPTQASLDQLVEGKKKLIASVPQKLA